MSRLTPAGTAMASEMAAQPQVLRSLLDRYAEVAGQVRRLAGTGPGVRGVAFLARGSSDHAALLGRYRVEIEAGLPTSLVAPSLHTTPGSTGRPGAYDGWLVIALSQSGRTPEIVDAATRLRAGGARTIAVTNDPASDLAGVADLSVDLAAGPEHAVPATKTVTVQMLAMLAIASGLTPHPDPAPFRVLDRDLVPAVAAILADDRALRAAAASLDGLHRLVVAGRGVLYPAALEVALKIQECTGVLAHGFSTADLRHGPIGVCGPSAPALLLVGSASLDGDTLALREDLAPRAARALVLGAGADALASWPRIGGAGECLLATVRGQQLALCLALRRGLDPDRPSGLQKVTLTH